MANLEFDASVVTGFATGNIVELIFAVSDPNYALSGEYLVTSTPTTTSFTVMYFGAVIGPVIITGGVLRILYSGLFTSKLLGPNEIDIGDGLAPVATITDSAGGRQTSQQGLRNVMYNPGQAALEFFKNTVTETSEIPTVGEIVHLRCRHAGVSLGRVIDSAGIATEAASWGDSGHRSVLRKDLSPLPRTSVECESAAAALVKDFGYLHYDGTYTQPSGYYTTNALTHTPAHTPLFSGEPTSGTVLFFQNLPATFLQVNQEVITQVKTTLDHLDLTSNGQPELFTHEVSFAHVDKMNKTLRKFSIPRGAFVPQDSAEEPAEIVIEDVGTTFTTDVPLVKLIAWDVTNLTFDTQQACPVGGGFEIRYTDQAWGALPSKNLVTRITSGTIFQVPRSSRGKLCCVRAFTAGNLQYSRFSAVNHIAFPLQPQSPTATFDVSDPTQVYLTIVLPNVLIDVWGVEIRDNDQLTVLYHSDLSDPSFLGRWPLGGNFQTLPPNLYVYTYNLLQEYSAAFNISGASIVPPPVTSLHVDDINKELLWAGSALAANYRIEIDDINSTFSHIIFSTVIPDQHWPIPDVYFFPDRFFRVTALNAAGASAPVSIEHVYNTLPVDSFGAGQIFPVDDNPTPTGLNPHRAMYRNYQWILSVGSRFRIFED